MGGGEALGVMARHNPLKKTLSANPNKRFTDY